MQAAAPQERDYRGRGRGVLLLLRDALRLAAPQEKGDKQQGGQPKAQIKRRIAGAEAVGQAEAAGYGFIVPEQKKVQLRSHNPQGGQDAGNPLGSRQGPPDLQEEDGGAHQGGGV